ncbi:23S rRNA pseudouridine(2605) synthase RluB [Phytohalomonas tamaricis]|uniref:23S rRNA pseudouridine(2605) synthase RluB n=1 Tax=Phytohalomonas tamaricis TaxID=2081032 RepID=UPI000D0BB44D|nr:23S rRNA pseudouridine(2605) synthase RluB [Phytohalomonas tamaricis]
MTTEKLQKVLARAGLGSRREMETAIVAGRVTVNGDVAKLGDRVAVTDNVQFEGRQVVLKDNEAIARRVIMYNKPEGELCTRKDPEGRRTVFERLPRLKGERWIAIGRLDINTSGLLLFTTDGELANRLMHPSMQIEREYAVRVMGEAKIEQIKAMVEGVMLEDGPARFTDVQEFGGEGINTWFHVVILEGRNREVRRLWESQGLTVSRLKRVRYGNVFLDKRAKAGEWTELTQEEIDELSTLAGLELRRVPDLTPDEKNRWSRDKNKRRPVRAMKAPESTDSRRGAKAGDTKSKEDKRVSAKEVRGKDVTSRQENGRKGSGRQERSDWGDQARPPRRGTRRSR